MPCQWKSLTGIECFGCGMQRAFIELLKGNLIESIKAYPPLIPMMVSVILAILLIKYQTKNTLLYFKISIIFTTSLMLINFILKYFFH
jgi:hypothetical protein